MITPLEVASVAVVLAAATLLLRLYFDARDAWWKRVQWAVDKALGETEVSRLTGLAALNELGQDELLMRRRDKELLGATLEAVINGLVGDEVDEEPPADAP